MLRGKAVGGLRFRLLDPIGPYVADFFCPSARLVVELDGYFHADPERQARDEARTVWLRAAGHRVLRFQNEADLADVLAAISQAAGLRK